MTHFNLAGEVTTLVFQGTLTTYTYDDNGNLINAADRFYNGYGTVSMSYDYENRMVEAFDTDGKVSTYTYSGDGLKRSELVTPDPMLDVTTLTTLVWDGSEYLGEQEEMV